MDMVGGGTFYVADSEITLTNNNVYGGHATVLADFFCNNNSTIKSENNTISGFHSTSSEVVLYNYGVFNSTNDTIKNCFNDFIIYNDESSELYLQNGTIVNNGANKVVIFNNGSASLYYNNISNNYVINMSSYVIYNEESCTIDMAHNLFVNNTDNTRDMLLNNDTGRTFNVESNNVYVDNFLEDYWYVTDTVDIISNEETPIHVINLRDVYNNVIVNGTIICYLEDSKDVFATFDVKNGYALITLAESPNLPLGEHIFKLEYESLSKHYQNLVGGVLRVNLKPELIDINVTAVWVDGNNQDGLRPSSVSVNLTANGVVVDNVILNETNGWKYSFADLPKFKDGSEIKYNFSEVNIPNYSSEVKNTGNEFKVINTHVPGTVEVNVLIVWDDANNNDGIAPNNIKIQLYADGKTVGEPITLNRGNNQYVFKDLPEYDGEKLIKYSVDELEVPNGYTKTSTNKDNIVTITNKHELEKVNFKVDIILEGLDNSLNQVNLQLYADGEVVGKPVKITLSTDNEFIFKNLLKYKNGKLIKYNVKLADLPEGFKESTTESQYGLVIKLSKITKKSTLKWSWKLLKIAHKTKHYEKNNKNHTQYTKKHSIVKKALKTSKVTIKHVKYIKHNNYSKYNRHKKYNNRKSHKSCMERVTYKYRLYIYLYGEYMNGSMSYDDFVAILKENNIKVSKSNWDKNGVLVIDYNDIKNVPDNITLHNKKGDVPDSTSKVNKIKAKKSKNTITEKEVDTKADNTKSDTKGVVDSDEIEVKTENN